MTDRHGTRSRLLAAAATLAIITALPNARGAAQARPPAPAVHFEVDRLWPKPLGNHWLVGAITGVAIDPRGHIWIAHRVDSLAPNNEAGLIANPPGAEICCRPAPPILEFDQAGTLVSSWGGPAAGFEWPVSPGGIAFDDDGNLWMAAAGPPEPAAAGRNATGGGGTPARTGGAPPAANAGRGAGTPPAGAPPATTPPAAGRVAAAGAGGGRAATPPRPQDAHVLQFSRTGQFIRQIGHAGDSGAADSTTQLDRPAAVAVDSAAHELYVADGGTHQRVVVFDTATGAFKRQWRVPEFARLSAIVVARDGRVFVGERRNNTVFVFKKDGTLVMSMKISAATTGNGSVWGLALSRDPAQQYLFVADGQDEQVFVLDSASLRTVLSFGDGGRQPGQFYAVGSLAVDAAGNVYSGEGYEGKRLQRFVKK